MIRQKTISRSISVTCIGLHSGRPVTLRMTPAAPGTGIVFLRNDVDRSLPIEARYDRVVDTRLCTCLGRDGVIVGTVEHLMSALYGLGPARRARTSNARPFQRSHRHDPGRCTSGCRPRDHSELQSAANDPRRCVRRRYPSPERLGSCVRSQDDPSADQCMSLKWID